MLVLLGFVVLGLGKNWIYGVFGLKLVIWKVLLLGCFLEK
jgi:hypothetical protein